MPSVEGLLLDPAMWILLAIAALSLPLYLMNYRRMRRIQSVEDSFPLVMQEISDKLGRGIPLEAILSDVAAERKDLTGALLREMLSKVAEDKISGKFGEWTVLKEVLERRGRAIVEAVREFGDRSGSIVVSRIMSIVALSMQAGASLSEVLDRVLEGLWSAYELRVERRAKTRGQSLFIKVGGSTFVPILVGLLFGNLGMGPIRMELTAVQWMITLFVLACSAISTIMSGLMSSNLRLTSTEVPLFMLMSYLSLKLSFGIISAPQLPI